MKKLSVVVVLAAFLVISGGQRCHAWSKFNFGGGFNVHWEGGGNSALWGLFKGSPMPECMLPGGGGGAGAGPGGYGSQVDGAIDPSMVGSPANLLKPTPEEPEKIAQPMPVKPANYTFTEEIRKPQKPQQEEQESQDSSYYFPSYWYGR